MSGTIRRYVAVDETDDEHKIIVFAELTPDKRSTTPLGVSHKNRGATATI